MKLYKLLILSCLLASTGIYAKGQNIENSTTLSVPDSFESYSQWESVADAIESARGTLILYWHGDGGIVDIGEWIAHKIDLAKARGARVIIRVNGLAASTHAFVSCHASVLEMDGQNGVLLFHLIAGAGNIINKSDGMMNRYSSDVSACYRKGILRESDIQRMEAGEELLITADGTKNFRTDQRLIPYEPTGKNPDGTDSKTNPER